MRKNTFVALSACAVMILAAFLIRLKGLVTDFWLDEIWAFFLARKLTSAAQIFTSIHFDTNHWLYTFFLYVAGDRIAWFDYRIPALVAGIATVPLMGMAAREDGPLASFTSMLLTAASYLLVVYSSEARGYALMLAFALLSFVSLRSYFKERGILTNVLFCLCVVLGFLSHLTFLFVYAGFACWSVLRFVVGPEDRKKAVSDMLRCHLAPCVFLAALYAVDIRHIAHGGADERSLADILQEVVALALGAPTAPAAIIIAALCCVVMSGFEIARLKRAGSELWVFYAVVLFLPPSLALIAAGAGFSYWTTRHFLVCVPFLLLLATRFLCSVFRHGRMGKAAYILLLALYMAGNGVRIGAFLRHGRGHYLDALRYMADRTKGSVITVGSDHDFRNKMVLIFYARYLPHAGSVEYFDRDRWPEEGPEWFVAHSSEQEYIPPTVLRSPKGLKYRLERHFPFFGPSGWHWCVYHNDRKTAAGAAGK